MLAVAILSVLLLVVQSAGNRLSSICPLLGMETTASPFTFNSGLCREPVNSQVGIVAEICTDSISTLSLQINLKCIESTIFLSQPAKMGDEPILLLVKALTQF